MIGIYCLIAFIVLHLVGIPYAELTDQKGIISRIVRGGEIGFSFSDSFSS